MKLSDKALRQIARKLFDRQHTHPSQLAASRCALRGPQLRAPERQGRAKVLSFRKRLR